MQSKTEPTAAAALAQTEIPPGTARDEALISVLNRWARRDPSGARRWEEGIAAMALRDRALGELQVVEGLANRGASQ